jgi:hypothetical protein
MATRVLDQGGTVVVFDRAEEPRRVLAATGATVANSASDVAARSQVVSVVVNTDARVEEVMLGPAGILAGASAESVVAIHSTIHLGTLESVAAAAAMQSVSVVDAAVTGGVDPQELARVITHSEAQSGIGPFFVRERALSLATGSSMLSEIGRHEAPKSRKDLHAALELADGSASIFPLLR